MSYNSLMMVNLVRYYDIIGTLISQMVFLPEVIDMEKERNLLTALLLMQSGGALVLQMLGIGLAYCLLSVPCRCLSRCHWMHF